MKKKENVKIHHKTWNEYNPDNLITKGDRNVIHHINGNHFDNRIENLKKMSIIEHSRMHSTGKKASKETKEKMSAAQKGDKNHFWGKTHTNKTKKEIGKASAKKIHSEETKKKISETKRINREKINKYL